MDIKKEYERWLANTDEKTCEELKAASGKPGRLEDLLGRELVFGTGGLRGVMGAGNSRMNVYTVRRATQGVANVIVSEGEKAKKKGVVVAYDCRHHSREFAKEITRVLAAAGITSYLFDELRPTPELSFAIRELHCAAGINVTASHNPKEYNGYKVYWEDGSQITPVKASHIMKEIQQGDIFDGVKVMDFEKAKDAGLVKMIGADIDEAFLSKVLEQAEMPDDAAAVADTFSIIYTPFHGTGYRLVPEVLRRAGFKNVLTVEEQMKPDGDFPTVKSPNPEEKDGFALAIKMARQKDIDLIIGTDPDADRAGIVVRNASGEYVPMTGNQVGLLLTDYIISVKRRENTLRHDAAVVTTIVSTLMADKICNENGVALFRVLTGFKYIGEKIMEFEKSGENTFLFGFEESYGYLAGTYTRDKDAVAASLLIAEMAAFYKHKGMTLYDALIECYKRYGYYAEKLISIKLNGFSAFEQMTGIMGRLRKEGLSEIGGTAITAERDYLKGVRRTMDGGVSEPTGLPASDVLYYELADKSGVVVRPSGTEPKIKIYLLVTGTDEKDTDEKIKRYQSAVRELLK